MNTDKLFDNTPLIKGGVERRETIVRDKGLIISLHPSQFTSVHPDTDDVYISAAGDYIEDTAGGVQFLCPLNLPDGAKILSCIINGNVAGAETWSLIKQTRTTATTTTIATAAVNTADTTITDDIVNNAESTYCIVISALAAFDLIFGGKIVIAYV